MQETPPSPMVFRYFLILFLVAAGLTGWLLWPFLSTLILALLLTRLFKPVYLLLNRRLPPVPSSLLTCTLILLLVFLPLIFFASSLANEATDLYHSGKLPELLEKISAFQEDQVMGRLLEFLPAIGIYLDPETIHNTFSDLLKPLGLALYKKASGWATSLLLVAVHFLLMIITVFFLLIDQEQLSNFCLRISPLPHDQKHALFDKFRETCGAVLFGNTICGLIQGILGGLLFALFDLGPPALWGGIMGFLAFLPVFGIGLVLIPTGVMLLLEGSTGLGVFVLIFYALLSFSVEYLLKPKLVGRQVKMHTLLAFFSIMGGLSLFGIMGIVYGPLILTSFLTLSDIYLSNYDKYVKT